MSPISKYGSDSVPFKAIGPEVLYIFSVGAVPASCGNASSAASKTLGWPVGAVTGCDVNETERTFAPDSCAVSLANLVASA